MGNIKNIFFDLDGTLIDPEEGIINSILYSIQKLNLPVASKKELKHFIGPPLIESYIHYFNLSRADAKHAVDVFREYFSEKGLYENFLYSEVYDSLLRLNELSFNLYIATSKPTYFAKKIADYHNIDRFFVAVIGSTLDHSRIKKNDIIQYILNNYGIKSTESIMVGDRKFDITGAKSCMLKSIAVTYGHGSKEELMNAEPDFVIDEISEIFSILDKPKL